MHMYVYVYIHIYKYVLMHMHTHTHKHVYIYWHTYQQVCARAVGVSAHALGLISIHICTMHEYNKIHTHTYKNVYTYTYTHACESHTSQFVQERRDTSKSVQKRRVSAFAPGLIYTYLRYALIWIYTHTYTDVYTYTDIFTSESVRGRSASVLMPTVLYINIFTLCIYMHIYAYIHKHIYIYWRTCQRVHTRAERVSAHALRVIYIPT